MSEWSVLGKSAALFCSLTLVCAYVYQSAGDQLSFSVRKSNVGPPSKREPRRSSDSIWSPDWQLNEGTRSFSFGADWVQSTRRRNMSGPKSAPIFDVNERLDLDDEDVTVFNADGTTSRIRLNGSSRIGAPDVAPQLGPPGTSDPAHLSQPGSATP